MSGLRRIIRWSLLAIIIQSSIFLYMDKVHLGRVGSFEEVKVADTIKKKKMDLKLPFGVQDVELSYDAKFVLYKTEDGEIKIVNSYNGKEDTIDSSNGGRICYYKWLPDTNRLILAEKQFNEGYIKFISYNPSKAEKADIYDNHSNMLKVQLQGTGSKIADIAFGASTGTMCIKVTNDSGRNYVYSVNIMNQIERVRCGTWRIGNINLLPHGTKIIYENKNTNEICVKGGENIYIRGVNNPRLLGVDDDDRLYIGELQDNNIVRIHYGNIDKRTSGWRISELSSPTDRKNIIITRNGCIYVNNSNNNEITNIETNKVTQYKGKFIGIYGKEVAYIEDGTIQTETLK